MYKFKSPAAGDLLMTQPVGDRLLTLIGKAPAAQGIIAVDQLAGAIAALEAAVAAEPQGGAAHERDESEGAAAPADRVSLRQRAWPMVDMMKRALAQEQPVVWGV